ncbi:right-handed parallel beta-helix repeat-containing protein [Sorangium sp. So ce136]|uniref:right-handed parallel beta-helix repeat-containing protein n=1 Tax=Sorangium sp. So ce136 TaxID=3133284 RepID=UPI003EFBCD63
MRRYAWYAKVFVCLGVVGGLAGCGASEAPAGCPPENEIRGACAGVPRAAVCEGDACTGEVACAGITRVGSDGELQAAAVVAASGACIALAPGTYGAVELPGGVSLLGRSAGDVAVGKVTLGAGEGAVLRGVTAAGIHVKGATGAKIESVHVVGSAVDEDGGGSGAEDGVRVDARSSVTLISSTIERAAVNGLYAVDPIEVSLDRVVIAGSGGPGLWIASSSECAAPAEQPVVDVKSSIVRGSHNAGVALFGARATFQGVDILATVPGEAWNYGDGGGGLTVASCSEVDAKGLRVHDSSSYGVLVDASKGRIGGVGADDEVEIHRNVIGVSLQNVKESFTLENAQLDENQGVGIGLRGESQGIIICRSGVSRTAIKSLPTADVGADDIGDGLVWAEKSSATITALALSGNDRASVLIDGEASGALSEVTLSGGDEALGIVQQNIRSGDAKPAVMGSTPALRVVTAQEFSVPDMPVAPLNLEL